MKIPKIKLITSPETEDAKNAIGYLWNDICGTRHFLGGKPDGMNKIDYPKCKKCNKTMIFYAQIDTIGDKYDLADCMVIHNFVCFDCFEVKAKLTQVLT